MPAYAGAATPAVTPGTISNGTPASRHSSASSAPRPNTSGSPPLSRTTSFPASACSSSSRLVSSCGICAPPPCLPTNTISASARAPASAPSGISRSCRITSARAISSSARAVISPGSPGPAPTRWTVPALTRPSPRHGRAGRRRPAESSRSASASGSKASIASISHSEPSGRPAKARSPAARACTPIAVWHEAPRRAATRRSASSAAREAASSIAAAGMPSRPWTSSAPWPGAGTKTGPSSGVAVTSSRPRRASPAAASTSASTSPPASLRSRVSTLPRSSRTSRSGRTASSCARRRSALVPTRAPGASASSDGAPTSTSRGSSRAGTAAIVVPGASSPGTSLALWTARSISPASSARSSAPVQRDLSPGSIAGVPPRSGPGASRARSPAVVISTISVSAPSRSATQRACASASALPRVPIRRLKGAVARAPRRRAARRRARPRARTAHAAVTAVRGDGRRRALAAAAWARAAAA